MPKFVFTCLHLISVQDTGCYHVCNVQSLLLVSGVRQYGHQKTASTLQEIRIKAEVVLVTKK